MPGSRGSVVLAGVAVLALLLAGCGGDDGGDGTIPPDAAESMLELASTIRDANDSDDCDTAQATTTELRGAVDQLSESETKQTLTEMVTNLDQNLDTECPPGGTSDEAEPEPEPDVEPTTTTPVEPTTTTETTTTVPEEEEEPETPEQPPSEGGGPDGPPQAPPGQDGDTPPAGGVEADGPKERQKPGKDKPKQEKS